MMGKQEDIFLKSEGNDWFDRNFNKIEDQQASDPVFAIMKEYVPVRPRSTLLEFGCSNGWRLNQLQQYYGYACFGADPSMQAIHNGSIRFPDIQLNHATMTAHPFKTGDMDTIIYGFCLYVADPEDHFEIAAQGNNILREGGYLIIHDFDPEFPHSVPNHHVEGLMTYKMDWSKLWLSNPAYSLVAKNSFPDGTAVWLLQKNQRKAFPLCLLASSGLAQSEPVTPET